jgi:tetratricopeptide (TPR) repeat protein
MSKVRREEVRRDLDEDVVVETGRRLWERFQERQNLILTVLLVAVVLWLGLKLFDSHRRSVMAQGNFLISQAQLRFDRAMQTEDEAQRAQWLDQGETSLLRVIERHGNSPLGARALFWSGVLQFHQLRFDEARQRFERFAQGASDEDAARGKLAIGACYENQAFVQDDKALLDQALEAFRKAQELGGSSYVAFQAMIAEARVLGRDPQTAGQAVALLEKVIEQRQPLIDEATPGALDDLLTPSRGKAKPPEPTTLVQVAKAELEKIKAQTGL